MNRRVFTFLFFLSGLCGLMYQILWTRLFSFALGNTYTAISIIVASFMFGLFVGAWLVGRYVTRLENELKWYAGLEGVIGLYAVALLAGFGGVEALFRGLYDLFQTIPVLHVTGKFLLTFLLIVVPTAAMGATLPLAVQYFTRRKERFGDNVSLLYAVNTIGGAVGVLLAGFYLIENLGIRTGLLVTAALNIGIGLVTWALLALKPMPVPETEAMRKPSARPGRVAAPADGTLYLTAAGLSGFAALAYEIVWTRGLKFLIHNSTYSFSVILFVFLVGVAVGSGLARRLMRRGVNLPYLFGALQLALGLYAIFSMYVLYSFSYSDLFQQNFIERIYDFAYSWHWAILIYSLVCALVFLVPTIIMGVLFPVVTELYFPRREQASGHTVSAVYAVNTVGGILGSLGAGFVLLPAFGIKTSVLLLALINLGLGGVFVLRSRLRVQPTLVTGFAVFFLVVVLALDGKYLYGRGEKPEDAVLFYREGRMATVKVFSRRRNLFMSIDGNIIAATHQTLLRKEKLIAHLPFMVKPDIREVLAVGLASGISVGSMSLYPQVERIDCVELIKPVFPAARRFDAYNYRIFENPKVRLIHDDIYAYLLNHQKKYDLISSDGKLGTLYSGNTIMLASDYYELSKQRLKEDGVFIQWLPIITPTKLLQDILNTLRASFQYVLIFYFYPTDIFMLASERPMQIDGALNERVFGDARIGSDLAAVGIGDAGMVLSAFAGFYDLPMAASVEINSFDRPFLEFQYMREWKKGRQWPGGYRARNLEFLLDNFAKNDKTRLHSTVGFLDKAELADVLRDSRALFRDGIESFKTRRLSPRLRAYLEQQRRSRLSAKASGN